jgi:hypothetical protein
MFQIKVLRWHKYFFHRLKFKASLSYIAAAILKISSKIHKRGEVMSIDLSKDLANWLMFSEDMHDHIQQIIQEMAKKLNTFDLT